MGDATISGCRCRHSHRTVNASDDSWLRSGGSGITECHAVSSVDGYQRGRDITFNMYTVRADTERYSGTLIVQNVQFSEVPGR